MKARFWPAALLAAGLLVDSCLAICQYPSVVGSVRILELSLMEMTAGLVVVVVNILSQRSDRARLLGALGMWLTLFIGLGALMQWRQSEIERAGARAVESSVARLPGASTAGCQIVGHRSVFFLVRIEYSLRCGSKSTTATAYFDQGRVIEVSTD